MLGLDLAVITFCFAVMAIMVTNEWAKMFAKHLFLIAVMITTFELYVAYGGNVLVAMLFVSISVWLVFLIFDMILLIPLAFTGIKRLWR